jgi:hypothetical protein
MFAKVFAASYYAATPRVSSHAFARFAHLGATLFHLACGRVVVLLSDSIQRSQG